MSAVLTGESSVANIPGLAAAVPPISAVAGFDAAPSMMEGGVTRAVVSLLAAYLTGANTRLFFDDYYNRVHVIPSHFNFGTITADTAASVSIWNAYLRTPQTLAAISVPSNMGVTLSGASIPQQIGALSTATFTVRAAGSTGPAEFDGEVTLAFLGGATYTLQVSGVRARLWLLRPNWLSGYQITYAFKTEVLTSRSGKEQRIALRRTPRRTYEFTAAQKNDDVQATKAQLWGAQHSPLVIPEETRFVRTSSDLPPNSQVVPLAEFPDWLYVGAMLVLADSTSSEMRSVAGIDPDGKSVTLLAPLANPWPAGTRVHFGVAGYLAPGLDSTRPTSKSGQFSVVFEATPAGIPFAAVPDSTFPMYDGAPVFLKKPNWGETVSVTSAHDVVTVDFDRGAISRFLPVSFGVETKQASYVGRDFPETEHILKLFLRSRGRLKPFWVPSWEFDIRPREVVPANLASIQVDGRDFHQAFAGSTVHKAVFVKFADGDVRYRRVISVSETTATDGSPSSTLTLSSAFGRAINPSADMVGWLYLARFASDELTLEWLRRAVATTQISYMTVEVEPNLS